MRVKVEKENSNMYKCCMCCHVRTGTVILGLWHLLLQLLVMAILAIAMIHPEVLRDRVATDPDKIPEQVENLATCRFQFHSWLEERPLTKEDLCVGQFLTLCTFVLTLMLVYGTAKGRPGYLMPFFCIQVFDFCLTCLTAVGYFSYMPNMREWVTCQLPRDFPGRSNLLQMDTEWLMLAVVLVFVLILSIKAYFVGVVWSCYKYLQLNQSSCTNVRQFTVDPDTEMLLPPKYEDVIKMSNDQPPPPPYVSN